MNRKSFFISLILFFITVFFAYSQTITIDNAVSNCVQYLQNRYPNSTRAALIFIQSENAELGEFVLNKVSAALVNSNWFRVVERNSAVLEQIDQELYLNRSLIVSRDTALSLGRQLGAQIIISGSFTRNGQNWLLDIQAVNAETAERTGHFTAENIRYDSALSQALTGAAIQAGPSIPANMVRIEGGTFQMGSASGGDSDERPVRQVTVDSFYMSIYEVTQKEWFDVMGTTIRQQRD
ncbi:MAG: SUMF1/EgtB/PvdO family nonheme iron enzyme, partial [Treponema sp.]|nr:SUMF1/EgtB/PvdO family nonheme iron enzyme [Treponema sp.]